VTRTLPTKPAARGYALKTEKATVGVLKVTQYELVMALVGDDSAKAYARVGRLLADLAGIPILRSQYYTWQNKVGFTLVDGATWIAENVDAKTMRPLPGGRVDVTVSFSPFVTEQFLRKHMKQVMLTPYLELSGVRTSDLTFELASVLDFANQGACFCFSIHRFLVLFV